MPEAQRLARLARVREVERRRAAEKAAASGGEHDRLRTLMDRSQQLAAAYGSRGDALDGAALAALLGFRSEMVALSARTSSDAEAAGRMAEKSRLALAAAQRRRDIVDERLDLARREIAQRGEPAADLARTLKGRGTNSSLRRNAS